MGFDEGVVVIKMGREEPAVSMDGTGKIVWAKYSDIETAILKPAGMFVYKGFVDFQMRTFRMVLDFPYRSKNLGLQKSILKLSHIRLMGDS